MRRLQFKGLLVVGAIMLGSSAARADVFDFTISGPNINGSGMFSAFQATNPGGQSYYVFHASASGSFSVLEVPYTITVLSP